MKFRIASSLRIMKFAGFDVEIADDLPLSGRWQDARHLGVSRAEVMAGGGV